MNIKNVPSLLNQIKQVQCFVVQYVPKNILRKNTKKMKTKKPKENKNKEINNFKIGMITGTFLSLPIILSIFIENIAVKIVGLLFLLLFIICLARLMEVLKENENKKA